MSMKSLRPTIITGLPTGTKSTGGMRADPKIRYWDQFIQVRGQRVWWSKALPCPCVANDQTTQHDPTCTACNGKGWIYSLPDANLDRGDEKQLDSVGNAVEFNEAGDGVCIRTLIMNATEDRQVWEKFGSWLFGTAKITVQSANAIGYRDRLVCRDAAVEYSQLIDADGAATIAVSGMRGTKGLWTPVASVTFLRTVGTIYRQGEDYHVDDAGQIVWDTTPPVSGTKLSLTGMFHPVWICLEHLNPMRATWIMKKQKADVYSEMPRQMAAKLDFLVDQ